MAYQG
jgi:hypothetical protein